MDEAGPDASSSPPSPPVWHDTWPAGRGLSFTPSRFDRLAEQRARDEARLAAAFDVCQPALALRAALLVPTVLVVVALAQAADVADWLARAAAAAFAGAGGTLLWLVALCSSRTALARLSSGARAGAVLLGGAACALVAWAPLVAIGLADTAGGLRLAGIALAGAGFAALLWLWLDLRARSAVPADTSARLVELQSRIRPHFLFNALNTALVLVRVDPARAERVLEDLAELFRAALAEVGESVALADEIELARAYLAIEQARYGERITVDWDLDAAAGAARVPPLVLQPLVENAVRHGVEPAAEGGRIRVATCRRRGQAIVTVSNTVPEQPSAPGHGMALDNVRERLQLLHDVAAEVEVWREGREFHARLVLPL
ncbi:sensor histidine kinase [Rubrivivax benzoatilyticus]|uniref:Sensor histidine kinase n=1 Tax=Rubrivivax benzoatilyticus TaxID=316997 RepID=A0ABX0HXX6_9BURK|nr:histidine kinase [Rubrivivax benzoatilyticus]EGJ12149.1 histidine kinase internal region [Rubrivivax benzoatilyticus JA2 = ATCC BAA-35]NHK99848.1 sensor histidine kinase [Rubrivivax benzoatilyticus]NHL25721.1 sensor histidine kinase [Rubrivivax benzoatilyticus]